MSKFEKQNVIDMANASNNTETSWNDAMMNTTCKTLYLSCVLNQDLVSIYFLFVFYKIGAMSVGLPFAHL
jgi:hypothetical protein